MNEEQLNKALDSQFLKFYRLIERRMDDRFGEVNERLDRLASRVETLHGAVDSLSGQVENAVTDNAARDVQLDRHDQALTQLADHTGVQLQYE